MSFPVKNAALKCTHFDGWKIKDACDREPFVDQNKLSDYDKFKYIDNF
jgi:hypothetical protein